MAKAKRYEEGGVTEGKNAGIDDDTRARAMKYVQEQSEKGSEDESSGEKTVSRSASTKVSTKPASVKTESKSASSSKGASVDDEAGTSRGRPAEGAPKMTKGERPMAVDSKGIPTRRLKDNETQASYEAAAERRSKEPVGPNSASGSELGRNVSAIMNATGPGKLATGLTLAAREAKAGKGVQEAYNARAAARRSEEGLSASEAATAKAAKATRADREAKVAPRKAREAKTLNPNAWMAGPKGMKDDFKSGGSVKGWGIARGSRKAKTY
jgi:hypothetical protein